MNSDKEKPAGGWEEELHEALKRLPDRPAPDTLLPRVMRAVMQRASLPWYQSSWWHWPAALRAVSATSGFALLAVLVWLIGMLPRAASHGMSGSPAEIVGDLSNTLSTALATALGAVLPSSTAYLHLVLPCFALLLVAMYVTCIGLGSAVYQFARHQRS